MKIEELMTRRVVACRPETDLAHVARLMWENDCGCVPVVDAEDRVVGIVTDRDICMGAQFQGRPLSELRASACMASAVTSCRPTDSAESVARLMGEKRVRRIPVTDAGGRLLGIVSVGDFFGAGARKASKELQGAIVVGLTAIYASPARDEIVPAAPAAGDRVQRKEAPRRTQKKRAKT
jgi:CBS domain-containing protein